MDALAAAWEEVAGRLARGELDDRTLAEALAAAGILADPGALERVEAALHHFWDLVQDTPAAALAAIDVAGAVARALHAPPRLEAELRRRRGTALYALGRAAEAEAELRAGLAAVGGTGDAAEQSRARAALLGFLGNALLAQGKVAPALVALEEAIAIARRDGLQGELGLYLSSLGNARIFVGEPRAAREYYEEALKLARAVESREGEVVNLGNLGLTRHALGDLEGARESYDAALTLARELGDQRSAAGLESNVGLVLAEQGDIEAAARHFEAGLELARRVQDREKEAIALLRLAAVTRERGALVEAGELLGRAEAAFAAGGDPRVTHAWVEAGRVRLAAKDPAGALALFRRAVEGAQAAGDRSCQAAALHDEARALHLAGRPRDALARLADARALAREVEDPICEAQVEAARSEALAALGGGEAGGEGDLAAADAALAAARALASDQDEGSLLAARLELARATLAAARGASGEAREALEHVAEWARERGMAATLAEVERRLAALPPASGPRAEGVP